MAAILYRVEYIMKKNLTHLKYICDKSMSHLQFYRDVTNFSRSGVRKFFERLLLMKLKFIFRYKRTGHVGNNDVYQILNMLL